MLVRFRSGIGVKHARAGGAATLEENPAMHHPPVRRILYAVCARSAQRVNLRRPAILHYASCAAVFPISRVVRLPPR
jgi:hypothetical protein